jgi:2-methylcitrate dehydratase PrpD
VARQAAHLDAVSDGLSAKFSIPYCVAHTILHGPPRVGDFESIDGRVAARAAEVSVSVDDSLPQWGAVVGSPGRPPVRVDSPRGTPDRPLSRSELASKVADLAGERLLVALRDLQGPAAGALRAAGLELPAAGA